MTHSGVADIKWRAVGRLGKLLIDAIFRTARIETIGQEQISPILTARRPFIAAVWHARILIVSYLYKGLDAAIMVSRSEDGEIIARVLQAQGYETVRGSTRKQGRRALAELIRRIRRGQNACIIPDGPQGPACRVQPGIITLARKTGAPIIPMTYAARRAKRFNSWDRFMLPLPFTRCRMVYGRPLFVPPHADAVSAETLRLELESTLNRLTRNAERALSASRPDPARRGLPRKP